MTNDASPNYIILVESLNHNIISFVARGTKSGKTYLLEQVIREMKLRGRKITAVKHAMHQHVVDHEGKDTSNFRKMAQTALSCFLPKAC